MGEGWVDTDPPPAPYVPTLVGNAGVFIVNPFHATGVFLYPLEKYIYFSYVFRGYRKIPVARYGLNIPENSVDCQTIKCVQFIK